jgi:protein SCO1
MKQQMRNWPPSRTAPAVFVMLLLAAGGAAARGQASSSSGLVLDQIGISAKLGEQLPLDLEFTDSSGEKLLLGDCFKGRPLVLHLVYYDCPMLCKLAADGLFSTLSTLSLEAGDDFSIMTLSFDPRETPQLSARARQLAIERCGKEPVERGWHFLTGQQPQIAAVTEAVGFRYQFDEETKQYAHAAGIYVLTPDGVISRYLSGINYSPRDLRLALVEASGGKVGSASDQVLLLCYMYNPATGKYGLAIITVLRAAGLATVGLLATSIVVMLRRERANQSLVEPQTAGNPFSDASTSDN